MSTLSPLNKDAPGAAAKVVANPLMAAMVRQQMAMHHSQLALLCTQLALVDPDFDPSSASTPAKAPQAAHPATHVTPDLHRLAPAEIVGQIAVQVPASLPPGKQSKWYNEGDLLMTGDQYQSFLDLNDQITARRAVLGSGSAQQFGRCVEFLRWYDKKFDKAFDDSSGHEIWHNLLSLVHQNRKTTAGNTVRSYMDQARVIVLLKRRPINEIVDFTRRLQNRTATRQIIVEKASGKYRATITFSRLDRLHMLHCCLQSNNGKLDSKHLQTLALVAMHTATGRRAAEMLTISATSLRLQIVKLPCGLTKRKLHFLFHSMKRVGPGDYHQRLVDPAAQYVEDNAVVLMLLYLERRRMIRSALEVYHGREDLRLDARRFETPEDLRTAVERARDETTADAFLRISGRVLFPDDDSDKDGDPSDRDDGTDGDPSGNGLDDFQKFERRLSEIRKKSGKEPLFVKFTAGSGGHLTTSPLDRDASHVHLRKIAVALAGYQPSKFKMIGFTCFRKSYIADSYHARGLGADAISFLDSQVANSASIRHSHYIDHDSRRRSTDSNFLQHTMEKEYAEWELSGSKITPAYDLDGYFEPGRKPHTDPLPRAIAFLTEHAANPTPVPISSWRADQFACPITACPDTFTTYGDLLQHVSQCRLATRPDAVLRCAFCDGNYIQSVSSTYSTSLVGRWKAHRKKCRGLRDQEFWQHRKKKAPQARHEEPSPEWLDLFERYKVHLQDQQGVDRSKYCTLPSVLRAFVYECRDRRSRDNLSRHKVQLLDSIGFEWALARRANSNGDYIAQLRRYKEEHGHCSVSRKFKYPEGKALGEWCSRLRNGKVDGLTGDQLKELGEMGAEREPLRRRKKDSTPQDSNRRAAKRQRSS
jgi:hypothetical protein